jgi:transcriptional regulator with XRE-family HTH domain
MVTLGSNLKSARKSLGYTQTQVQAITHIHHKTLSGYENNVSKPDIDTLKTLAKCYETSVDELTQDSGYSPEDIQDPRLIPIIITRANRSEWENNLEVFETTYNRLKNGDLGEISQDKAEKQMKHIATQIKRIRKALDQQK